MASDLQVHAAVASMTFGRKPFRCYEIWSKTTFGRYDISSSMTFRLKIVDLRRNSLNFSQKCADAEN